MSISSEQCRAARALLDWSQQQLACRAKVARKTIADFELGQVKPYPRTLRDVVAALEDAGVSFLPPEDRIAGAGVRLKWTNGVAAQSLEQSAVNSAAGC
jgi:transcriptional regulator with XRE-family HTH domain